MRTTSPVLLPGGESYRAIEQFGPPLFPPESAAVGPTAPPRPAGGSVVENINTKIGKQITIAELLGTDGSRSASSGAGVTVRNDGAEIGTQFNLGSTALSVAEIDRLFRALGDLK